MKLALLAGLLLAAVPALAQMQAPPPTEAEIRASGAETTQPFKRANVITLYTSDSTSAAYSKVAKLLLAAGYPIDRSDKDLGYINTNYRVGKNREIEEAFRIAIVPIAGGAKVEVRGIYRMPGMRNTFLEGDSPIDFRGALGSPAGHAWQDMIAFAASYNAPKTTYKLQR